VHFWRAFWRAFSRDSEIGGYKNKKVFFTFWVFFLQNFNKPFQSFGVICNGGDAATLGD